MLSVREGCVGPTLNRAAVSRGMNLDEIDRQLTAASQVERARRRRKLSSSHRDQTRDPGLQYLTFFETVTQ